MAGAKKKRSDEPLDGFSGVPFQGACLWRMDVLGGVNAPTPNSHNWIALEGATISGGLWNLKATPNLANKFIRANTSAGGTSSTCSHSHTIGVTTEQQGAACAGTGHYMVTSSSTFSNGNLPPYYDLEIWLRKE